MDGCLESLAASPECPGDSVLVFLVRLQHLVEQLDLSRSTWPHGNSLYERHPDSASSIDSSFYVESVGAHVEKIGNALPADILNTGMNVLLRLDSQNRQLTTP